MNRLTPLAIAVLALSGCATFNSKEVAYLRTTGIPASTLAKLDRGKSITPQEIITLRARGVPDSYVLRHLDDHGVDYLVSRSDVMRMRRAGVSIAVIDAVIAESEEFAHRYTRPTVTVYDDPLYSDAWYFDPVYPGPRLYSSLWW
jgi:hypothetical protein